MVEPPRNSFAHSAAKLSWRAPLFLALSLMLLRGGFPLVRDFLGCTTMVVGLTSAVIALAGIPKHGLRGLLAPALIGGLINTLLVLIFLSNFFAAPKTARSQVADDGWQVITFNEQGLTAKFPGKPRSRGKADS